MKIHIYIYLLLVTGILISCSSDSEFLDRPPSNILTQSQVFNDPDIVLAVVADLYNRYNDFGTITNWPSIADFNVAFWSEAGQYGHFEDGGWGYGSWATWDYGYIRELNLFLQRLEESTELDEGVKSRFAAEGRFLRASYYFELVKRMGGVPLILEPLTYDFSGDPIYLRYPRAKESEIYDFVISEAEAIKDMLPADAGTKGRATKAAALAMEARAALYAGSIAKYGATTPQVSLSGGEVGIPVAMAPGYYNTALTAAQAIINGDAGNYALYTKITGDLSTNFASLFYDKSNNQEVIFVEDFKLKSGKVHGFTQVNQPRFNAEEEEGGRINPSLNLVESFETLDGQYAPLPIRDASGNLIEYEQADGLFAGRDARLEGTVIVPGSLFKGRPVDIFGGLQLADGSIVSGDSRGQEKQVPGSGDSQVQVVGFDGPIDRLEFTAQTGFYIRKYQDPKAGSGERGTGSDVWFVRYRYAEVLLNAAEAAFELGQPAVAAEYMNQVRSRAGITVPLTAGDVTFAKIVHERYVEFAFEGLYFFDLKRWRLADKVFDGVPISPEEITQNIGSPTKRETQVYGLYPYKIYNPGAAGNGYFTYRIVKPSAVTGADRFQLGNYYSEIGQGILNNNPLLVRNPNQ